MSNIYLLSSSFFLVRVASLSGFIVLQIYILDNSKLILIFKKKICNCGMCKWCYLQMTFEEGSPLKIFNSQKLRKYPTRFLDTNRGCFLWKIAWWRPNVYVLLNGLSIKRNYFYLVKTFLIKIVAKACKFLISWV